MIITSSNFQRLIFDISKVQKKGRREKILCTSSAWIVCISRSALFLYYYWCGVDALYAGTPNRSLANLTCMQKSANSCFHYNKSWALVTQVMHARMYNFQVAYIDQVVLYICAAYILHLLIMRICMSCFTSMGILIPNDAI